MTIQPQLITSQIIDRVNHLAATLDCYADSNSFPIKRLLQDAEKLTKKNFAEGHAATGMIYTLCGDIERAREEFKIAEQASGLSHQHHLLVSLSNTAYFEEAADLFAKICHPDGGLFTSHAHIGFGTGAYDALRAFIAEAARMEIKIDDGSEALYAKFFSILEADSVTETEARALFKATGEVLRARHCFYGGDASNIKFEEPTATDPGCAHILVSVPFDVEETAKMNFELAHKIAEMPVRIPNALCISFIPTIV